MKGGFIPLAPLNKMLFLTSLPLFPAAPTGHCPPAAAWLWPPQQLQPPAGPHGQAAVGGQGRHPGAAGPPNSGKSTFIWDLLEVRELPDQPPDDVAGVRRLRGPGAAGGRKNRGFLIKNREFLIKNRDFIAAGGSGATHLSRELFPGGPVWVWPVVSCGSGNVCRERKELEPKGVGRVQLGWGGVSGSQFRMGRGLWVPV